MTDMPLITIGITSYNAQDTIEKALESAYAQKWSNKEVIVVDDCSSDGTMDVLGRLIIKYPDLKVIQKKENQGVAASRNQIIEVAKGEFIAFFDDDDVSLSERVSLQYSAIKEAERTLQGESFVICHTARLQKFPNGNEYIAVTAGCRRDVPFPKGDEMAKRLLIGVPLVNAWGAMPTCSQMARTSIYKALDGFDVAFRRSEDTEFNIRAARAGACFVGVEEPLVIQNMTLSDDKIMRDECVYTLKLYEKHKDFVARYAPYPFFIDWINFKYSCLDEIGNKERLFLFLKLFLRYPFMTAKKLLWARYAVKENILMKEHRAGNYE